MATVPNGPPDVEADMRTTVATARLNVATPLPNHAQRCLCLKSRRGTWVVIALSYTTGSFCDYQTFALPYANDVVG